MNKREYAAKYYIEHKDALKAYSAAWRAENPERTQVSHPICNLQKGNTYDPTCNIKKGCAL